jgi:succinyl-CoA synthetase alpha subunit
MGGDVVAGTSLVDALRVFEQDDGTRGIVLVGEVGGTAEEEAAEWIRDYRRRVADPKYVLNYRTQDLTKQAGCGAGGRPLCGRERDHGPQWSVAWTG